MIEVIFFLFFSAAALAGACSLILQRNPIYSALSLIIVIASMGGLFLLLNAAFLAVLQIVIYAGAIMVLFLFVIMMIESAETAPKLIGTAKIVLPVLFLIAAGAIWAISGSFEPFPRLNENFQLRQLSRELYTTYLFPFEAIAVLIISSVIGSLFVARKEDV